LGRIIGLIGCTCLVVVAMRLTNLQQSGHTLKGGEDREGFHAKMQPREHFKRGKDSFLRGRYQDALQHLEVIRSNDSGLTVVEQRQAADYLSRAKSRLQAAATGSVVRAQSSPFEVDDDWSDSAADDVSSSAKDSSRSRVDRLMSQAESALKKGNPKEAIKLAQQAHRIAIGSDLKYAKAETSPAMFLSRMSSDSSLTLWSESRHRNDSRSAETFGRFPRKLIRAMSRRRLDIPQNRRTPHPIFPWPRNVRLWC